MDCSIAFNIHIESCWSFGSPGIVMTSPVKATMKPAPNFGTNSRMVISKFSGAPSAFGLSEKLY